MDNAPPSYCVACIFVEAPLLGFNNVKTPAASNVQLATFPDWMYCTDVLLVTVCMNEVSVIKKLSGQFHPMVPLVVVSNNRAVSAIAVNGCGGTVIEVVLAVYWLDPLIILRSDISPLKLYST